MKHKNWFWGSIFLVGAVLLIGTQVGSFDEIGTFSILASVLLVAIIISSIFERSFFGIFVPAAILYAIFEEPFHLPEISTWTLILAAVFVSMGLGFIFRRHPHCHMHHHGLEHSAENMDDNNPYIKVSFGSSSRYLHADCLKSGTFIASFGALEVFFDQATLSPEGAKIDLDCNFGGIKLYIPKHWKVIDNLHTSVGGVDNDTRFASPAEGAPCLTLNGTVQIGGVEIKYI